MKWEPADIIIALLTSVIVFILLVAAVTPIVNGIKMSEGMRDIIADLMNALIAIISFYIGSKMKP